MSSNEARERVLQLKHAIWHLDALKMQLKQNASNSKAQIHANVSQIMECLRGREVSLLSQVDQTLRIKEETLHHQQVNISQALGVLQTGLSVILNGTASERQLDDIIEKLKGLELMPEETPYISFRSSNANLLEPILNYGSVDGNGQPLMATFGYPGKTTPSFPSSGYYDVDHNGLFNLDGVKRAKMSAPSVSFVLPQLSNNVEDWLQKKNPSPKTEDNKTPTMNLPASCLDKLTDPMDTRFIGLSSNSTSGSLCDLSTWLFKQNVDLKEQPDLDLSCFQTAAVESKPSGGNDQSHVDSFQSVGVDLKDWLSRGSGCPSSLSSTCKAVQDDSKAWLLQACQQLTSLNELKHKNHLQHVSKEPSSWLCSQAYRKQVAGQKGREEGIFFSHVSKEPSSWLCSQAYRKQLAGQKGQEEAISFSHVNKDKDFWLQKQSKTHTVGANEHKVDKAVDRSCDTSTSCCRKMSMMDVDEKWLSSGTTNTPTFQMKGVCRANELCGSISECVSKPDCCTLWFREKSPIKNVIDPTQAFKPLSLELHEWLSAASQNHTKWLATAQNGKDTNDLFHHIQNTPASIWLMNPALNVAATQSLPAKFKGDKEECNLWLQKTGSTSLPESSPSMETVTSSSTSSDVSMSDWLMVANKENDKHQEMHDHDKESEGWSICSDSHSACTDQCTKDIAAANEYYSKWLF